MIKPTVGRVVWFWAAGRSQEEKGEQPYAATVAFVHSDTLINISYVDYQGNQGRWSSVLLWQGEGERPTAPHCSWMPYQVGQAKKDAAQGAADNNVKGADPSFTRSTRPGDNASRDEVAKIP